SRETKRSRTQPPMRYASNPPLLRVLHSSRISFGTVSSEVFIFLYCSALYGHRSRGETDITAVFGTAIPGSNPGGSTETKNAPRGAFLREVLGGAMSRKHARPRAGVAKFPSDGEKIFVTSKKSLCGYGESNPDLVLGKDAFYH